mmetsp:Transcript_100522/g.322596  ORF Transcript_100522/g.322596 Transcript_100522/m.322596 type:complete len:332 (-) Transcript_100522:334-1329(-)
MEASGLMAAIWTGVSMPPNRNFAVTDLACNLSFMSSAPHAPKCAGPTPKLVSRCRTKRTAGNRPCLIAGSKQFSNSQLNLPLLPRIRTLPRRTTALHSMMFMFKRRATCSAVSGARPITLCMGSGESPASSSALLSSRPPRAAPILPVSKPRVSTDIVPVLCDPRLTLRALWLDSPTVCNVLANKVIALVSAFSMARWSAVCLLAKSRCLKIGTLPTSFSFRKSIFPWYTARQASHSAAVSQVGSRRVAEASPKKGSAASSSTAGFFGSSGAFSGTSFLASFCSAGDSGLFVPLAGDGLSTTAEATLGFARAAFAFACASSSSFFSRMASG